MLSSWVTEADAWTLGTLASDSPSMHSTFTGSRGAQEEKEKKGSDTVVISQVSW